ncbi:MAG: SDR family oxidoreductase [Acutalibacteraceae bacterium]|nr:SDR family oxidoreductase [Acutalibacteraceae bacterium]
MSKTVLITGASKGIGATMAIRYAEKGYNVVMNYHNSVQSAILLQKSLKESGYSVIAYKANVRNRLEVDLMVKEILYKFGSIDILINNAGIANDSLFTDLSEQEWNDIIGVNLTGVFNCCQAVLPHMINQKSGSILNISSMWGEVGASCEVAYSASKAGVIGLTKALAKEVGPSGITVNCITPGLIDTTMNQNLTIEDVSSIVDATPMGRIGTTNDVASTALFLTSEDAGFITGQIIGVNGGFVI